MNWGVKPHKNRPSNSRILAGYQILDVTFLLFHPEHSKAKRLRLVAYSRIIPESILDRKDGIMGLLTLRLTFAGRTGVFLYPRHV